MEPRGKKVLDPVLEDREDIDYYEGFGLKQLITKNMSGNDNVVIF